MLAIPNYQELDLIYEGSNSEVYRAQRQSDNLPVILKVLKQERATPQILKAYQQEYEITKNLDKSGIIQAYDLQEFEYTLAIVLEDFGGTSLRTLGKISIEKFLSLAIKITDCLDQVHQSQVIHKDINPANIVWNRKTDQLKIIDFGISTQLPKQHLNLQNPEKLEGTLAYISPEQTGRMNRLLDYRTDLYSLGVTFYELLTGQLPFKMSGAMELVHCHIAKTPQPVCDVAPNVPPVLSDIVMMLMTKDAENRYQSAFGVKWDLEQCLLQLEATDVIEAFELGQRDFSDKLHIPQKLYGRKQEIQILQQTFERVSEGNGELMLVAGYAGVGKTALVHEVHKPMTEKQGYFATGKFDQYQRNVPYFAITQAFGEFCNYLLTENEETLRDWKQRILKAVGNNGQVLVDIIPELKLIIGPQASVVQVGDTEAQNRFNLVFLDFFQAICKKNHPLVLFIDDLQWADSASLNLLKLLLTTVENHYFLIIGAYRDNEIDETHPLMVMLEALEKTNNVVTTICLQNLRVQDINQLVSETLKSPTTEELSKLVYEKTQGNAFFVHQFLQTLYENNLLQFDFEYHQWQWDIEQVAAAETTSNVVYLMVKKISKLPLKTIRILQLAACIGNQFDLSILSIIYGNTQEKTLATALWAAIIEGLIQPLENHYQQSSSIEKIQFKFFHDKIQQAAYSSIEEKRKQALHLQIGRLLLKGTCIEEIENNIFDLTAQFNHSLELITDADERYKVAALNLIAGRRAKNASAYEVAVEYLTVGISLLDEDCWQKNYALALDIHTEALEAAYFNADYKQVQPLAEKVLDHAHDILEKIRVYKTLILYYSAQNYMHEAIDTGLNVLSLLGITLVSSLPQNLDVEKLAKLPVMTDPQKEAAMHILMMLFGPIYTSQPHKLAPLSFTMLDLCVKHGNSPLAPYAYALYGLLCCGVLGNIDSGYQFGKLALNILDHFDTKKIQCRVYNKFYSFTMHWKELAHLSLEPLENTVQIGLETGEIEFTCYAAASYCHNVSLIGISLEFAHQKQVRYLELIAKLKQEFQLHYAQIWGQFTLNLVQTTPNPTHLTGSLFNEEKQLSPLIKSNNISSLYCFHLVKVILHYLFKEFSQAVEHGQLAERYENGIVGLLPAGYNVFYHSLALLAAYPHVDAQLQKAYLRRVDYNQNQLEEWALHAPMNFQHKYELVEAEKAQILGNYWEAVELYERAIVGAKKYQYLNEEALAYELAAEFYLQRGMKRFAKAYLKDAHYRYQQWGAIRKVMDLEQHYPRWLISKSSSSTTMKTLTSTIAIQASTNTQANVSRLLDLESIMKASQMLSGEIVLAQLLKKMMRIVIENTGAERGFLILPYEDQWVIEAEGSINSQEMKTLHSLPIVGHLPEVIINYVARTRENVVLANASQEGLYTKNSYIQKHQTRSVLCFPIIYQKQLQAILYFENNLVPGAFTPQRLSVLTILSSHIAISLENARFVEELKIARQQAEAANHTKTAFLANVSHELRTPLNAILGYAQLLNHDKTCPPTVVESSKLIQQSSHYLLTLINDIIDISTVEVRQMTTFPIDIHLNKFLTDLIQIFQRRAQDKGLYFTYFCSPELPMGILSDEKRLRQILSHLLSNAVKFTQEGEINFSVIPHGDHVQFQVEDTGAGISPEDLDRLFLPFEQLSDWQHKSEGAGLGLSLVKKIVEALEGNLCVASQVGQGSCFQVYLPLVESIEWRTKPVETVTLPVVPNNDEANVHFEEALKAAMSLLSAEQIDVLYDLSMNGDVNGLIQQADELEQLSIEFMPLVEKIRQTTKVFDTDPIADLLAPLQEGE